MEPGFALFSPNFLAVSHNGPIYSIKYSGLCVYYRGMCQLTELLAAVTVGHSCAGGQTPASAAQDCEAASSTLGPSPCWGVQIVQGCFLPWCQSLRCRTRSWIAQDLAQEICSVWRNWPYLEHWLNSPCKSCGMRGLKAAPGSVVYCRSSWLHLFPHNFFLFIFFFCFVHLANRTGHTNLEWCSLVTPNVRWISTKSNETLKRKPSRWVWECRQGHGVLQQLSRLGPLSLGSRKDVCIKAGLCVKFAFMEAALTSWEPSFGTPGIMQGLSEGTTIISLHNLLHHYHITT